MLGACDDIISLIFSLLSSWSRTTPPPPIKAKHYSFYNKIYGSEKLNPILGFHSFLPVPSTDTHSGAHPTLLLLLLVLCGWMHLNSFYGCVATFSRTKGTNNFSPGPYPEGRILILETLNIHKPGDEIELSWSRIPSLQPSSNYTSLILHGEKLALCIMTWMLLLFSPSSSKEEILLKRCQKVLCNKRWRTGGREFPSFFTNETLIIQYNVEKEPKCKENI